MRSQWAPRSGYISPGADGHLLCRDGTRSMVSLSDPRPPREHSVCYAQARKHLIDRGNVREYTRSFSLSF